MGETAPGRTPLWPAATVVGLFTLLAVPLILSQNLLGRGAFDQLFFHERVIRQFAAQWPNFDLRQYESATTPGYHILLAAFVRFVSPSPVLLQLVSMIFTVALLATMTLGVGKAVAATHGPRANPLALALQTLALGLPLGCSMYVVMGGIWLLPENLAWLGVVVCLLLSLRRRFDLLSMALGGLSLELLVLVRHNHLWCAAPLCVAAWLSAAPIHGQGLHAILRDVRARTRNALVMALMCLPAFAIVGLFFGLWEGATPPWFQSQHTRSINWATPAFVLSIIALIGPFFLPFWLPGVRRLRDERAWVFTPWAAAAIVLAAVPTTTYLWEARGSGLWIVVQHAPVIFRHTSVVLLILAPIGAVIIRSFLAALPQRQAWILGIALLGFTAAQTTNSNCWQRYIEPLVILLLSLMAACVPVERRALRPGFESAPGSPPPPSVDETLRWVAPVALSFVLALQTAVTLIRAEPPPETRPTPDGRREPIPRPPAARASLNFELSTLNFSPPSATLDGQAVPSP